MLKSLAIKNFKTHKNTKIEFSNGINIFVGKTQHGKTNIFRSLLLLLFNRPLGGGYLSDYSGSDNALVEVEAKFTEGNKVLLQKDIKKNKKTGKKELKATAYTLNDKEEFSSISDRVIEVCNISELNIQKQLDPPFLITSSQTEIARAINRITNIEQVDNWQKKITKRINSQNKDIALLEGTIKKTEEELKKYEGLEVLEKKIKTIEILEDKLADLGSEQKDIDKSLSLLELLNKDINELRNVVLLKQDIERIDSIEVELKELIDENNLIIDTLELTDETKRLRKIAKLSDDIQVIEDIETSQSELSEERQSINKILLILKQNQEEQEQKNKEIKILQKEKGELLKRGCPTCGAERKHWKTKL